MKLSRYTRREVARRPGRALLTLAGIAIGVASVVSVSVASNTARTVYREMFETVTGRAALEVVGAGEGAFDGGIAPELGRIEGVRAAVPVVWLPSLLVNGDSRIPVYVLGVDPERDRLARDYVVARGDFLGESEGALLEEGFAASLGLDVGSRSVLLTPARLAPLRVAGLLEPRGAAALGALGVVFLPIERAQELFGLGTRVSAVHLVLEPDADEAQVREAVARALPVGLTVKSPLARGEIGRSSLVATEQGLANCGVLSLVAGAFIILNSFLMNVGERRRHLAILRALGATRGQIQALLVREGLAMGLAGTAIGIALGAAGAWALTQLMEGYLAAQLSNLRWTAEPFVLAALLGPCLSLAAVVIPARKAAAVSPLEGLARETAAPGGGRRTWPLGLGAAAIVASFGIAGGVIYAGWPGELTPLSLVVGLVGGVLVLPSLVEPLASAAARLASPFLGGLGPLALRQVVRNRTRSSLTIGVLFVATSVGIGMGNSILANVRDVREWYARAIVGDFFVRGKMPDAGTASAFAVDPSVGDRLRLGGVERVDRVRFVRVVASGRQMVVVARSLPPDRPLPMDLIEGDPEEIRSRLAAGEIVVGSPIAVALDAGIGDEIELETPEGPRTVRVAGVVTEYTAGGMASYMEFEAARRLIGFEGVDSFIVHVEPGRAGDVEPELARVAAEHGLALQSLTDLRASLEAIMVGIVGFLWILLALSFLVAALGIVNTLTMNVLEQTREVGLLRAIAMTRRQVRRLIVGQAAILGLASLLPSAVSGLALCFIMNVATHAVIGQRVEFRIDATIFAGSLALALVISIAAAWIPARRAARLDVLAALQYE